MEELIEILKGNGFRPAKGILGGTFLVFREPETESEKEISIFIEEGEGKKYMLYECDTAHNFFVHGLLKDPDPATEEKMAAICRKHNVLYFPSEFSFKMEVGRENLLENLNKIIKAVNEVRKIEYEL